MGRANIFAQLLLVRMWPGTWQFPYSFYFALNGWRPCSSWDLPIL